MFSFPIAICPNQQQIRPPCFVVEVPLDIFQIGRDGRVYGCIEQGEWVAALPFTVIVVEFLYTLE